MQATNDLKKFNTKLNYQEDTDKLKKFLLFYTEDGQFKYLNALRQLEGTLVLDLKDLAVYDETGLATRFEKNAYSYLQMAYRVVDDILYNEEVGDVFFMHRISRFKEKYPDKKVTDVFPSFLLRSYTITLKGSISTLSIREIGADMIGALVGVRGVVTKIGQVKPSVQVATYICESCGAETYQQINNDTFDQLEECASEKCKIRNVKGTLVLVTRGSKFLKYQMLVLQELTSDVPQGCVPRMMNVECYASMTDQCRPGELVTLSGIFMPKPYYGFKKLKAGLLNDTYLLCMSSCNNNNVDMNNIDNMSNIISHDIQYYIDMLAPEIFGMTDVKKILLLMLVGAPELRRHDGMKIRGDINVLLMGDPGIAKSQLLKTIVKISRRGVYTTGKGSSGVGLTASVSKDQVTGEVVLEGGALVLSDKGVCCIDELDKMNDSDRVAIHEVMEQQCVSVSKAGINTTLNARCAVLGAANPIRGRYDPKRSLEQNIGLPISLLSRFDVLCILKDDPNKDSDLAMANHITSLHLDNTLHNQDYTILINYINKCKSINPVLSKSIKSVLIDSYVKARADSNSNTPRHLLSLIRLTLAHARLRFSETAEIEDANAAISLLEIMKIPSKQSAPVNWKHEIYNFIISKVKDGRVNLEDIFNKFEKGQIESVIKDFENTGVWALDDGELIIN